ncbi:bifunctional methylenetetrahydrofolate dehydrogenase/methenyltetrahydrofolate cyclohydrolase FolD [Rhodobacteraceae bacterium]|nr:bifunctional methylenetetrahydrofolate dehydrogenase/methenyltetrahydrofolate cyclohydrolase FolD [Paracoccaceae bacterium]
MSSQIIDGKGFAATLRAKIAHGVETLQSDYNVTPGLAVVLVGTDPASEVYVRNKARQTVEVGMTSFEHKLPDTTSQAELLALIETLNTDPSVHGILVQLPLPDHIDATLVINAIAPQKDVDGFHVANVGMSSTGQSAMVPCTPLGCLMLLRDQLGSLRGKTALVIGRSNIVGRPMARLLIQADCSVIVAHRHTTNTAELCRMADIVVVAVGQPGLVRADWIKPGATVIDVGINRIDAPERGPGKTRLVGDVAYDEVAEVAGAITPVPGGVGPMTIACLLANTLIACARSYDIPDPEGLTP